MQVKLLIDYRRGGKVHPAGSEIELDDTERADLDGLFEASSAAPVERAVRLIEAIAGCEPGKGGKPTVATLKKASGLSDVNAAERDAAWEAHVKAAGSDESA